MVGVTVVAFLALGVSGLAAPGAASGGGSALPAVSVFPVPGGVVAAPATQITFRGIPFGQIGSVVVTGSQSGVHSGRLVGDSDGMGGSFLPAKPFKAGEVVTVTTGLDLIGGDDGSYHFTIATPALAVPAGSLAPAPRVSGDVDHFVSAPGLQPARVVVNHLPSHAEWGYVFVAPQAGPVQNGPLILGPLGGPIWFMPLPRNDTASDFRAQTYQGRSVLTGWQGNVNGAGVGDGIDEIYNSSYEPIATVRAANGLDADLHEFQLTPQNTALITAYYPVYWNASSVKGSRRAIVLDSVVQEIDIPTGLVLFQWDSLDHVTLDASDVPYPTAAGHPFDYFHVNSIQEASDGNLIVSSRNTSAVYELSAQTGAILWTLGGKHPSFKMGTGTPFAYQHDARLAPDDLIRLFDDESGIVGKQSRALTIRLDTTHRTATLVSQDEHDPPLRAGYEGSVQALSSGDELVGWGQQPFITEFNASGAIVFDAHFVGANSTYRAYRFPWNGVPTTPPAAAARAIGKTVTVYVSWNGATSVVDWRLLGGASTSSLTALTTARWAGFETAIRLARSERYVAVQALNASGQVIGTSNVIRVS